MRRDAAQDSGTSHACSARDSPFQPGTGRADVRLIMARIPRAGVRAPTFRRSPGRRPPIRLLFSTKHPIRLRTKQWRDAPCGGLSDVSSGPAARGAAVPTFAGVSAQTASADRCLPPASAGGARSPNTVISAGFSRAWVSNCLELARKQFGRLGRTIQSTQIGLVGRTAVGTCRV